MHLNGDPRQGRVILLAGVILAATTPLHAVAQSPVVPFVSSTVHPRFDSSSGLSTLRWSQTATAQGPAALAGVNVLVPAAAASIPTTATSMAAHGKVTVGLMSSTNPVYVSDESVRGRHMYPALWLRKGGMGLTGAGSEPSAATAFAPGDEYTAATTEFAWPTVTATVAPRQSGRGQARLLMSRPSTQAIGFHSWQGAATGRVTTAHGLLRAVGASINGAKRRVALPPVVMRIPTSSAAKPPITLVVLTQPAGTRLVVDSVGLEQATRTFRLGLSVGGVLPTSTASGPKGAPTYSNAVTFFVATVHDAVNPWELPVGVGGALQAQPGSQVLAITRRGFQRAVVPATGSLGLSFLDSHPSADSPPPEQSQFGGCIYGVERAAQRTSLEADPVTTRGHVGLGSFQLGGRRAADLGTLAFGKAVVDGVAHELTPGTADLLTRTQTPRWERSIGMGPLSPYMTDGTSAFIGHCAYTDGRTQLDPAYDAFGSGGGVQLRAVWDFGAVAVEGSLFALAGANDGGPPSEQLVIRLAVASRDGLPHVIGLSAGLVDVTAPLKVAFPKTEDPSAPVSTELVLPEAQNGFVPLRVEAKVGHFDVTASGEAARPDGASLAGRYAGPAVTMVTKRSSEVGASAVPGRPISGGADLTFVTGAGNGAGIPSYYASLLVAVVHT
jgi:hypothetical protein